MTIIALTGYKQSGKSTVSKFLQKRYGFFPINFKGSLIEEMKKTLPDFLSKEAEFHKCTVDRVRFFVQKSPLKTHDNRAMGGVMKVAQKIGLIEPTGETRPSKVGHKVPMQVWRSCIYNINNL